MEQPYFTLQMLETKLASEKNHHIHEEADAFICVAMSHGNEKGILRTSDWQTFDTDKQLLKPFDAENWPIMLGKPKIFLFQMCRGGRYSQ